MKKEKKFNKLNIINILNLIFITLFLVLLLLSLTLISSWILLLFNEPPWLIKTIPTTNKIIINT